MIPTPVFGLIVGLVASVSIFLVTSLRRKLQEGAAIAESNRQRINYLEYRLAGIEFPAVTENQRKGWEPAKLLASRVWAEEQFGIKIRALEEHLNLKWVAVKETPAHFESHAGSNIAKMTVPLVLPELHCTRTKKRR